MMNDISSFLAEIRNLPMSEQQNYLAAIEAEEARLRERLAKLAKFKELAIELGIAPDLGTAQSPPPPANQSPGAEAQPVEAPPVSRPKLPWEVEKKEDFDGTFRGLIAAYRTHEKSPYHKLKHSVRRNYDQGINRLDNEVGSERVADWNAARVQEMHDTSWAAGGKASMGHSMLAKLRLLCSFGSVVLNSDACTRLSTIIGNMRFAPPPPRKQILTYEHVRAIRSVAHSQFNWPSIALAQALQFEISKLRQVDIIGRWVPLSEPGPDDIKNESQKWVDGLLWSDIDDNFFLRKKVQTGRNGEITLIERNLKRLSMVMEEINSVPPWKRSGPMIICEYSGKPWSANEFRRKWRIVADAAGVPSNIQMNDGARGVSKSSAKSIEVSDDSE
ncbi:hypothetical protein ACVIW2_005548 [Bradyrhizobium huanghuaihaiense]